MTDFFINHGYPALFFLSFLAATVVPLGSEWLLIALLLQGLDPKALVVFATAGNTLGACTTYWIGLWGGPLVIGKILGISEQERQRAEILYNRHGSWSLLLSWLPVIGDPLCLAGGMLRVSFVRFLLLVLCGKLARYITVSLITLKIMPLY